MDKATIKRFIAWCDEASEVELDARRKEILALQGKVSAQGLADVRLALRLLDEEALARLDLARLSSGTTSP